MEADDEKPVRFSAISHSAIAMQELDDSVTRLSKVESEGQFQGEQVRSKAHDESSYDGEQEHMTVMHR